MTMENLVIALQELRIDVGVHEDTTFQHLPELEISDQCSRGLQRLEKLVRGKQTLACTIVVNEYQLVIRVAFIEVYVVKNGHGWIVMTRREWENEGKTRTRQI